LHKKFPNQIVKTIQISGTGDPSYQVLRLFLNHQDNPYFPKILAVKMFKTDNSSPKGREREFDLIDVDMQYSPAPDALANTLYVVSERLFDLPGITESDLERLGIDDFPIPVQFRGHRRSAEIKFRMAFKDWTFRKQMYYLSLDKDFKQALRLLEPLFRHYESDMHGSNVMIRENGHWVIVDPVTNIYSGSD